MAKGPTAHKRRHRRKRRLLNLYGPVCYMCGVEYAADEAMSMLTFDHVIPLAKGGPDSFVNIRLACKPCNNRKADNLPSGIVLSDYLMVTRKNRPNGRRRAKLALDNLAVV